MRNSKSNTGQELYESIMSDLKPIVKSLLGQAMGLKPKKKLNEMSDEMLDRAIVAAVDKGDFERAKKFSDYKKSDERKQNMEKAESQRPKNDIRYKINARGGSKEYIDGVAGGVITKTYYGKINIFKIYTDEITDMFADMLLILCKDKNKDISLTFTKDIDGNRPGSVQTGTRCDNKLGSNRIEKLKSTQMFKSLESILSGKKGNEFLTTLTKLKFSQMTNGSETVIKVNL